MAVYAFAPVLAVIITSVFYFLMWLFVHSALTCAFAFRGHWFGGSEAPYRLVRELMVLRDVL